MKPSRRALKMAALWLEVDRWSSEAFPSALQQTEKSPSSLSTTRQGAGSGGSIMSLGDDARELAL